MDRLVINRLVINKRWINALFLILAMAFLLRVVAGISLFSGSLPFLGGCYEKGFWECGYVVYGDIAINLVDGKGMYYIDEYHGKRWSSRPPLYPLMLAGLYIISGKSFIIPVLIQSILGTLTVLFVYLIGKHLFGERVGIFASVLAAIYPYYVFHDTSIQENALFTLLTAVTIFFLLKSSKSVSLFHSFLTGIFFSLAVLTRVTLLTLVPFAVLWFMVVLKNKRSQMILVMLLGFIIVSTPWLIRNTIIHGKPVFALEGGIVLWVGHNEYTLVGYPYEHIDTTTAMAWTAMPAKEKEKYKKLSEVERNEYLKQKAIRFIKEKPLLAIKGAFLKTYADMSWNFSPDEGGWIKNASYTISYMPLLLLGMIGIFLSRDKWRELSIIYSLFITFIVVSAIFLAHTSHRIYLDIYLMILSSYAVMRIKDFISQEHARTIY